MGYLQNGICWGTSEEAKNDFLSRIGDFSDRVEAMDRFKSMATGEIRLFFPDCVTAVEHYYKYQAALLSIVVLLLCLAWIKKAAMS